MTSKPFIKMPQRKHYSNRNSSLYCLCGKKLTSWEIARNVDADIPENERRCQPCAYAIVEKWLRGL